MATQKAIPVCLPKRLEWKKRLGAGKRLQRGLNASANAKSGSSAISKLDKYDVDH